MGEIQKLEIDWYRLNGFYSNRIVMDNTGDLYVIGDWAWRKMYGGFERIEHRIKYPKEKL